MAALLSAGLVVMAHFLFISWPVYRGCEGVWQLC